MSDINIDSVLDRSLDDIEDLPSFQVPMPGTYLLLVSAETKEVNEKPAVIFNYEVIETVELADKTAKAPLAGDKFGEMFFLSTDDGLKYLKKAVLPYADHYGEKNIGTLVRETIQNVQISATVKRRYNKDDKEKETPYAQLSNVVII